MAVDRRQNPRPEAVSPQRAAILMDVSESTIRRLIRAGKLPATRLGRLWRILITDLRKGSQD
jgi:excisionase family DNA binding protein